MDVCDLCTHSPEPISSLWPVPTLTWAHLITAQVRAVAPHAGVGHHGVPVAVTLTAKESTEGIEQKLSPHPGTHTAILPLLALSLQSCEDSVKMNWLINDMQNSH